MRRRQFIGLIGGVVAGTALPARAQQSTRIRRIGILLGAEPGDPEMLARLTALDDGLRSLGWIKDSNIHVDVRWYGGSSERALKEAKDLVAAEYEIIVANATVGIEAAMKATKVIPIVFVTVGNPVGSGYVASMSRPGANVTGFSAFEPEIAGKWLQLLREAAPATKHVTVLSYPGYEFLWKGVEAAAAAAGVPVEQVVCHNTGEIEATMASLGARSGAGVVVLPAPVYASNRELLARLAVAHKLPVVYPFRYYALGGGLLTYGFVSLDVFRRAPAYVDRILKGESPAELPIQAPVKFELVINLKAAKAIGMTLPSTLLASADEVFE